jgi:hypothetical protein
MSAVSLALTPSAACELHTVRDADGRGSSARVWLEAGERVLVVPRRPEGAMVFLERSDYGYDGLRCGVWEAGARFVGVLGVMWGYAGSLAPVEVVLLEGEEPLEVGKRALRAELNLGESSEGFTPSVSRRQLEACE